MASFWVHFIIFWQLLFTVLFREVAQTNKQLKLKAFGLNDLAFPWLPIAWRHKDPRTVRTVLIGLRFPYSLSKFSIDPCPKDSIVLILARQLGSKTDRFWSADPGVRVNHNRITANLNDKDVTFYESALEHSRVLSRELLRCGFCIHFPNLYPSFW